MIVSGKAIGRRKPLFEDWSIPCPPDSNGDGGFTVRDLIDRIVREEVNAFRKRQTDRQFLKALTADAIAEGANKGKIEWGQRDRIARGR